MLWREEPGKKKTFNAAAAESKGLARVLVSGEDLRIRDV